MARAYSMHKMRNLCKIWLVSLKRKRPLRRSKHVWKDNIKTDFKGIGWEDINWIHLTQDRTSGGSCVHGNEHEFHRRQGIS